MNLGGYVELHARSAFSFLRASSLPEQLAERASELGMGAMAVCDRMGVYGAPRFYHAARGLGVRPILGVELAMAGGGVLPVLIASREGYRNLCRLLTRVHLRSEKGRGEVGWEELREHAGGWEALTGDEEGPLVRAVRGESVLGVGEVMERLEGCVGKGGVWVEVQRHFRRGEERVNRVLAEVARSRGLGLVATNGVVHAKREGRAVLDIFTCLRHHTHLDEAGELLSVNDERHLKRGQEMRALFGDMPEAVENTERLAERLNFSLEDLGYEFPRYPVGEGETMEGVLREQTHAGARARYPGGVPERVRGLLAKELGLIGKLGFAGYFLIVADIVRFCRERGIMAQGRGSAANSAVCFCLRITAVDPVKFNVLFERFLSEGRKGWPDIDIDLPSGEMRESVIQEVYRRHGPHGAAMTATVISYRGRSAAREVGKALNLPLDILERFSGLHGHGDFEDTMAVEERMERAGLSRGHPRARAFAGLCRQASRLPRHLGQHTGGMILGQGRLDEVVVLENASMPGRVVAQWDKDDCEELGIIKVDLLGLGMMAVLQETLEVSAGRGRPVDLAQLPENDAATYALLQRADTVGVFQVESRAQMATLPRMKPRCFYDLVIEVALIRPGPIQGDLAHPYLRRRSGEEAVAYYDERLRPVLERTLGVPLFQEQMLKIAMVMADFSGDEAEELRRALSFHRSDEKMRRVEGKLRDAMARKGVSAEVAERIVKAVGSFALYGFPESHAISFALLAYASAYLKVHRTAEFYAALLNQQPMGFYSPATLVRDAKQRGMRVLAPCVVESGWGARVISDGCIRLGLGQVKGLRRESGLGLVRERERRGFGSLDDFRGRVRLSVEEMRTLAEVGALGALTEHRRDAMWAVAKVRREGDLFGGGGGGDGRSPLERMTAWERMEADYGGLQLTTGQHPMALVRGRLPEVWCAGELGQAPNGAVVRVAGQVICRQRPGTAKGICFVSLEDETGISNAIVSPELFEAERLKISMEPFLLIEGEVQARHGTIHIKARRVERLPYEGLASPRSHDFR